MTPSPGGGGFSFSDDTKQQARSGLYGDNNFNITDSNANSGGLGGGFGQNTLIKLGAVALAGFGIYYLMKSGKQYPIQRKIRNSKNKKTEKADVKNKKTK